MVFFVPARKGSKRVKDKNLRSILGKPLVEYTFDAISYFEGKIKTYVSTDDQRIADMALERGFFVIHRPVNLADDKAKMSDVLSHALGEIDDCVKNDLCILYPTSPLRANYHILEALDLWEKPHHLNSTLMSVSPVDHRPYGLMEKVNGNIKCLHPYGELFYQAQQMPILYRANGAIYIIPGKMIMENQVNTQLFCKRTIPYVMDDISGFEIDIEVDIIMAEALMRYRGFSNKPIRQMEESHAR